ncbi:Late embryogenesis abundant (LEA) hydroxyproline-rich glycoprotein family [Melia azedarach]|uniref:Late embryogenesis abundant (LEA) hydroxyproline-rich glycoprotein family n=1 Tax=Melia azedarach TaxID=155640 RepID=A0ACC1WXL8_MELAZ|nr:Late embryogenesis abundant (LEA) hydroxyproline-rich glycoprotein family [Melia azedarach]
METPDQLPVPSNPEPVPSSPKPVPSNPERPRPPIKRHHTARYYANMVRESLMTRLSKKLCVIFLMLLLTVGIILFVLWLSLRPHRPRFFIQEFSIPALAEPAGFENAEISFNATARNSNQHIGIYYDSMEVSVYYREQRIGATPLAESFFQEPKTTTLLSAILGGATLTVNSQRWMEFMNDRRRGRVTFRLEIKSTIRFKVSSWWDSKRHTVHANCPIVLGSDGSLLPAYKNKRCPVYFT